MNEHKVIIVGGGFGGLYAAQALKNVAVTVTLLDRRNFHLFQPLLYQVATGTLAPGDIASPLRLVLEHQKNVQVLLAEVTGFNVAEKKVILRDGQTLPYDTLLVATGSEPTYFGHDDWRKYAPGLKTVEDATAMRSRILWAFESAERETDPEKIGRWLTFAIVGAGPTGVELAGALAEVAHKTLRYGFRHIKPASTKVLLIDAVDLVLPGYSKDLSIKAREALEKLGVTVRTGCKVTNVHADGVDIDANGKVERIWANTVLWATGVRASPLGEILAKETGATVDKGGRVLVNPDLSIPTHPNIFVIGDMANPSVKEKQNLPGLAPVAMQQGKYVAQLIASRLEQKETTSPFHYHDRGNLATIGRNKAIADLGHVRLSGFFAWIIWAFVHVFELLEVENRVLVMLQWAWSYLTWNRSDLLITHPPQGEKNEKNS